MSTDPRTEPATVEQWRAAYEAKLADFARETARLSRLVEAVKADGHTDSGHGRFRYCGVCTALREVTASPSSSPVDAPSRPTEDTIDIAGAQQALADPAPSIPLDEVLARYAPSRPTGTPGPVEVCDHIWRRDTDGVTECQRCGERE